MPRQLRMEFEGGVYHVINRGNYRHDIFEAERTKAAFLKCLDEACEKTGWRIHAWCVMSNHYHLAVETPQANLVGGSQRQRGQGEYCDIRASKTLTVTPQFDVKIIASPIPSRYLP